MIKAIIFDYDGVIVDSFSHVHQVYITLCKELGKYCPTDFEEFKKIYGSTSTDCYINLGFSELDREKADIIYRREIIKQSPKLFFGITEVLNTLHKKYALYLISSSYIEEVTSKLAFNNLEHFFCDIVAKSHNGGRFEKTESIKKLLLKDGLDPEEVILVGDRNVDFLEGRAAGLKNILLVDYGWGYDTAKIPEYVPKFKIDTPADLKHVIEKF